MKLANDYLRLRKCFAHIREETGFPVTMNQIAEALNCTPRNAKLILNKLIVLKWIYFTPGRGRGHTSELLFLKRKQEILQIEAAELIKAGNTQEAFELVAHFGDGVADRERFVEWLTKYFGYQVESAENQYVETLKLPIFRSINTLDPKDVFYALDSHLVQQIFRPLVEYDFQSGEIRGSIAHHWSRNDEATEWTFYLRKGVQFHHGRELTAYDVRFSLERLQSPDSKQQWLVQSIEAIEIITPYVIRVKCKRANYLLLHFLSFTPMSIVPKDRYELPMENRPALPIGCGPYTVDALKPGMCALEAFPAYFQGRAFIDRIEILIVPELQGEFTFEPKSEYLMVHSGETAKQSVENWQEDVGLRGTSAFSINIRKPGVLQDVSLRKALTWAINRQKLVTELRESRHYPSRSLLKLGEPVLHDPVWKYAEARQALQQSSYQGEKLQLYTYARHAPDAFWLQKEYAKIGIQLEVNLVTWADMLLDSFKDQADLILFEAMVSEGIMRNLETYQSPFSFVRSHLGEELAATVDHLIENLLAQPDERARVDQLNHIEQLLLDEFAMVFLVYKSISTLSPPTMQGVQMSSNGWVNFKDIWYLVAD